MEESGLSQTDVPHVGVVVATYVLAGFVWIVGSDPLGDFVADVGSLPRATVEVVKGFLFVLVTAGVLFIALRRWAIRLAAAAEQEREAARQLRHAQELRASFLQGVSHELRTPLTSILGYGQTIHGHCRDLPSEKIEQMADRLVVNARQLQLLVLDLLDVDRMIQGVDDLHRRSTDLAQLARTVVDGITAPDHAIRVSAPDSLIARVDRPKVERIIEHLVRNSVRHTPPATRILLRLASTNGSVTITVEDDGPGLPPGIQAELGRPFVQGPDAVADASPGLGIGLALVHRHTHSHGGDLTIEQPDDGGTRITVSLPDS